MTVVKDDVEGLIRTAKSITDQSITPRWIIITPFDRSRTHEYSQKLFSQGKVTKIIQDESSGVYPAMNLAIDSIQPGDWVWFLNAGDEFASQNSYDIAKNSTLRTKARWLYGGHNLGSERGEVLGEMRSPTEFKTSNQLFAKKYISHQAVIFKAEFLQELNGFDVQFKVAADWELMSRAALRDRPDQIKATLANFYMGGLSTQTRQKGNLELLRIRNLHLPFKYFPKSYLWFAFRCIRNFFVQSFESNLPELTNKIRRIRILFWKCWGSKRYSKDEQ